MRTVILYGNSLSVSSVGASLSECAGLHVASVSSGESDTVSQLIELQPDVIIFDLMATQSDFALALLQTKPGLLLVGVDMKTDKALVLSGETSLVVTTDDFLRVIERHITAPEEEQS